MLDINLISHIVDTVEIEGEDSAINLWKEGIDITYGNIIIGEHYYIYIKAEQARGYKDTLVDITMPLEFLDKPRLVKYLVDILL